VLYTEETLESRLAKDRRECYEPSEASIEWSATTMDGYEGSSIISRFGGHGSGMTIDRSERGMKGTLCCVGTNIR
jgi:hypothetical protein